MEIWVTSEDLGAYGHDIGVTLPELLWQLVGVVPEGCMLRLGMTNPPYIMEHLEVCVCVCVCACIHEQGIELIPPTSSPPRRRWQAFSPTHESTPSSTFPSSVGQTQCWQT